MHIPPAPERVGIKRPPWALAGHPPAGHRPSAAARPPRPRGSRPPDLAATAAPLTPADAPSETASRRRRSQTGRRTGRSGAARRCRRCRHARLARRGARRDLADDEVLLHGLASEVAQLQVMHDPAFHRARTGRHARRAHQPRRRHLQPSALELAGPAWQRRRGLVHGFAQIPGGQVPDELPQLTGERGGVLGAEAREGEHRRRLANGVEEAVGGQVDRAVAR